MNDLNLELSSVTGVRFDSALINSKDLNIEWIDAMSINRDSFCSIRYTMKVQF